jgi:hypothetical protein
LTAPVAFWTIDEPAGPVDIVIATEDS